MQDKYTAFANKVLFWPLLKSGHNSLSITLDKYIATIYEEAKYLLVYSAANNRSITFNMVCIRLKELHFEDIKDKSPEMYEKMGKAKSDLFAEFEKRRKESSRFERYYRQYMLGLEK